MQEGEDSLQEPEDHGDCCEIVSAIYYKELHPHNANTSWHGNMDGRNLTRLYQDKEL